MAISMDKWGVTPTGFYRPTIDDIIEEKNKIAKGEFGDDFDIDELTPEGKFFRTNASAESKLCEIAEGIYYSIFPHTATGVSLDRVCEFANLSRGSAGYAQHILRIYGSQDFVIEAGTEFQNPAGVGFYAVESKTIDQEEEGQEETVYYADVIVQCKESGTIGNVTDIDSTLEVIMGIHSVTYWEVVAYGTEVESDPELRTKFETVNQGLGTNTEAAIKANVLRLSNVNAVIIVDNNTPEDIVMSNTLTVLPYTYAVIVHSDDMSNSAEIAEAIREKQPLGIGQSGNVLIDVMDDSGTAHKVKFTYVEPTPINVAITCTVDSSFEQNGVQAIKDSITKYINSRGIGEEVIYSQLFNYVYDVTGVYRVGAMTINGATQDIAIEKVNIAKIGNISVTVEG